MARTGWLLVCEPVGAEQRAYRDPEQAVRELGHALRTLIVDPPKPGKRFRPVASSPGWKPKPRCRKYERLAWLTVPNPEYVREVLRGVGIEGARIRCRPGTAVKLWDVVFDCPPELKEQVEFCLSF
jgi:hypothetical protein